MNLGKNVPPHWQFLGLIMIICVTIWSFAFYTKEIKTYKNTVSVIGVATKDVVSDFAKWKIDVVARSMDRSQNISVVYQNQQKLLDFLHQKGFSTDEMSGETVTVDTIYKQNPNGYGFTDEVGNYETRLTFTISTKNVAKVSKVVNELRAYAEENGINLNTNNVEYSYLPFESEKIPLLEKAIIDAQNRANALVNATKGVSKTRIGKIVSAQQGVFQVNASNDNSVSDYGNFDTGSVEKTIRATVTVEFQAN